MGRLEFLKARFDYCKEIYYKIEENNDKLENKMKFLTSFMVIFLSAVVLNVGNLEKIIRLIYDNHNILLNTIIRLDYILITLFFLFSVICVFLAIKIRTFDEIYPKDFSIKFLFSETDFFINEDDQITNLKDDDEILTSFYYTTTKLIIHTIDNNSKILKRKARWFHLSWSSLLLSIFLICLSLIVFLFN